MLFVHQMCGNIVLGGVVMVVGSNLARDKIYLRNKETQQSLRVIVSIQHDASFSANDIYP